VKESTRRVYLEKFGLRILEGYGVTEGGRLFVRGPNVMAGYLRAENPGVLEPPHDGWHDTGDIVTIDAQGFVTIKGRAKRFAKVGGEMISFAAIEALAADLWPNALSAVSSVPDARKGERLILMTQQKDATRSELQQFARSRGGTELMVPAEVVYMEKMPLLGTGKVDNMAVAKLIKERAAAQAAQPPAPEPSPASEPQAAAGA
jgi:acyl-[acyl-carrier-protein]-phospholipid O-acyltransferase/long-chain-fatty-acid--[acyl-carrier-protein] ligase